MDSLGGGIEISGRPNDLPRRSLWSGPPPPLSQATVEVPLDPTSSIARSCVLLWLYRPASGPRVMRNPLLVT